jgi:hypothetical protein
MPNYMLLIYGPTDGPPSSVDLAAQSPRWDAYTQSLAKEGLLVGGDQLHAIDTASTVRVRGGETQITDGPFAATREFLAGYYLLGLPGPRHGARVRRGACRTSTTARSRCARSWTAAQRRLPARMRVIDRLRRGRSLADRTDRLAELARLDAQEHRSDDERSAVRDDRLRLIFTCCHPALGLPARTALTLRMLGGLTTSEIAVAFLVAEPTIGQRCSRHWPLSQCLAQAR